jgi:hypothetical protein
MARKKSLQRLYEKMREEPVGFQRIVLPYKRKSNNRISKVRGYFQSYEVPRGKIRGITPDRLTGKSQTMWLMNKQGEFVGRANYKGETTAKNVTKYGYDETTANRDTRRYKRIFGRISKRYRQ